MPMFSRDNRIAIFKDGMKVGIFAPAKQQAEIIFNRVRDNLSTEHTLEVMQDPEINVTFDTNNGQNFVLRFQNLQITSNITCMSASDQSNIEGKTFHLVVVDEAQDVGDMKYLKSITPMLAFYNGSTVLIGTPTISIGFFYASIERNKTDYEAGKQPELVHEVEKKIFEKKKELNEATDKADKEEIELEIEELMMELKDAKRKGRRNHFEYDYKTVIKYNKHYAKHIEAQKRRLGVDSDEFKMSYCLQWMLQRGMFVDRDKFGELKLENEGTLISERSRLYVAGIDLGKTNDSTVVTIGEPDWENPIIVEESEDPNIPDFVVYDVVIKGWLEIQGDNWDEQYDMILEYLDGFRLERVAIDGTGVGSPMCDRLIPALTQRGVEAFPFVFSTPAKSDLFKHYDSQIKSGRLHYPADEYTQETLEYQHFIEQHEKLEKTYSGQHMVCAAPKVRGAHDDYPCSAALMMWAAKGEAVQKPVTEKNVFTQSNKSSTNYTSRNRITARRRCS
jgi:hypothetical protein